MSLTKQDLEAIEGIVDRKLNEKLDEKLAPIKEDITIIKNAVRDRIEIERNRIRLESELLKKA